MHKPQWLWTSLALVALALTTGCGDDDSGNKPPDDNNMDSDGGNGSNGGDGDGGGDPTCDLSGRGLPKEEIPNPTGNITLTRDKVWQLKGTTYVQNGQVLKIDPCTRIEGDSSPSVSTLVVSRGGKIMAEGTADEPILFTSKLPAGMRTPGNWGGVILLGKARNFKGDDTLIEGLDNLPENRYGGNNDTDSSGKMAYVRIEFGGFELMPGNEINGLTMGSVGSGTEIHHIMVNTTRDDCFEWFGGTVNASYLICNGVGDDMFDADQGYRGKLEYLFGRLDTTVVSSGDPNGFEMDGDNTGMLSPATDIEVSHATLCGGNKAISGSAVSFGMVLRENLEGSIDDVVVTGFDFGVDTRDAFGTPAAPNVSLTNALFFGMRTEDVRGTESGDDDNDMGFDEDMWFAMGSGNEIPSSAPFTAANCLRADGPNAAVTGSGIGAFAGSDWNWDGQWIDWSTQ